MRTTRKIALAATALAVGLVAVPAVSASALRPAPGDDGGGGGPIEPPTTTTQPPSSTPRRLESLSVTTDSVVATATIRYSGDPSTATVQWGDGTSTTRCPAGEPGPVHSGCFAKPWTAGDPPGTIVLQHVYAAPANGAGFTVAVTAQLAGESTTVAVGVTPRYRVTQGTVSFSPLIHCDTFAEEYTEWRIDRVGFGLVPAQTWEFDRLTNPRVQVGDWLAQFEALPGSGFSVELTAADLSHVGYDATEKDEILDRRLVRVFVELNPLRGTRTVALPTSAIITNAPWDEECEAEFRADITVELLVPGATGGGGGPVASL